MFYNVICKYWATVIDVNSTITIYLKYLLLNEVTISASKDIEVRWIQMLKHIKVIGSLGEISGSKLPKEHIIQLIERLPLMSSLILLSQLSSEEVKEEGLKKVFRELYNGLARGILDDKSLPPNISREVYARIMSNVDKVINNNIVFSQQSILNLWKWLLSYGNTENLHIIQETKAVISAICYLSLATNDYLYKEEGKSKEDLYAELFSNAVFNHQENAFNAIARTMLIYTEIAKDKTLYHAKEFLDINQDFYNVHGYTIKEHIAIIFGIIACFLKPKELGARWLQNIEELFADMKNSEKAKEIVLSLATDFKSISEWAKQELDSPWNFIEFRKTPLLLIDDKQFLPFSLKLLYEQLFTGLFHKVRHIYPDTDRRFLTFYGKPFERYTQKLALSSVTHSKLPYEVLQ